LAGPYLHTYLAKNINFIKRIYVLIWPTLVWVTINLYNFQTASEVYNFTVSGREKIENLRLQFVCLFLIKKIIIPFQYILLLLKCLSGNIIRKFSTIIMEACNLTRFVFSVPPPNLKVCSSNNNLNITLISHSKSSHQPFSKKFSPSKLHKHFYMPQR
jgi:hypothetical protein